MRPGLEKIQVFVKVAFGSMPFADWPRPTTRLMLGEIPAGITVALIVIPQSVAYASIAGMPLITGIYASFIPALVALLLAASPRLSVGPTALCSLLVGATLTGTAIPGSAHWIELTVWLALLSGLFQILLGSLRMGWLLKLVSSPVLMGFTQAAAAIIVFSQLRALLGAEGHLDFWNRVPDYSWSATAFGVTVMAVLIVCKRWAPKIPVVLILLIASALVSWFTSYAARGGSVVGPLPMGLPDFYIPSWPGLATIKSLLIPAAAVALVGFLETASSARVDNQMSGRHWNENQDLIAQGAAKVAAGFIGSFPISSSFSRSAVNILAGAKSGWSTLIAIAVVFVFLMWLTPYLYHVPQSVLAAVVIGAVSGLIRPQQFIALWRVSKAEFATALITLVVTLITAPEIYWGVLTGVGIQILYSLLLRFKPRIIELGLHVDGTLRDRKRWGLPLIAPDAFVVRMDSDMDFVSANAFSQAIINHLNGNRNVRHVAVMAQSINRIDVTGIENFSYIRRSLESRRIVLHLCGLKLPVEMRLRRAGELPTNGNWPFLRISRTEAGLLRVLTNSENLDEPQQKELGGSVIGTATVS